MPDEEHGAAPAALRVSNLRTPTQRWTTRRLLMSNVQSGLRPDALLREVQERLAEVVATRGRMQGLIYLMLYLATGRSCRALSSDEVAGQGPWAQFRHPQG